MKAYRAALLLPVCGLVCGQDWPHYGGDAGGMKHSPLKQINRSNVSRLRVAWTYHTGDMSDGTTQPTRSAFETTPLMVDGVVYLTTPLKITPQKRVWRKVETQYSPSDGVH